MEAFWEGVMLIRKQACRGEPKSIRGFLLGFRGMLVSNQKREILERKSERGRDR